MAFGIHVFPIESEKSWALGDWLIELVEKPLQAFIIITVLFHPRTPIARTHAFDRVLRTGPIHGRRLLVCFLGRDPDGLAAPELCLVNPGFLILVFRIAHREETLFPFAIVKIIRDDTVMSRIKPGHDGVVIWKSLGGKAGDHPLR